MNITPDIALRPCPFCGGEATIIESLGCYAVRCAKCGAETREVEIIRAGLYIAYYATIIEAAKLWNKRVSESE